MGKKDLRALRSHGIIPSEEPQVWVGLDYGRAITGGAYTVTLPSANPGVLNFRISNSSASPVLITAENLNFSPGTFTITYNDKSDS